MNSLGLNDQQLEAYEEALQYVKGNTTYKYQLIEGYAGTGKTWTILKIIREILDRYDENFQIAITAPTNKAVKVLKDNFPIESKRVSFITIHKLLGLKPVVDEKGVQSFQAELFGEKNQVKDFKLIIIDEVSMLADELFYEVTKYSDIKIIFMGDPAQIPPINKMDTIPLQPLLREEHSINSNKLTKIMRQGDGNPIIDTSFFIRENISKNIDIKNKFETQLLEAGIGMEILDISVKENAYAFVGKLRELFTSENFKTDANFAKIIAWRNDTVNMFNTKIREMIYGKDIPKICIGEKLIADNPIVEKIQGLGINVLFNTNDEFEVKSYKIEQHGNYKVYSAIVEYETMDQRSSKFIKKTKIIKILHEEDEAKFRNKVRKIADSAKALRKTNPVKAKQTWVLYYDYQNMFAQVNYNYAITAHKSQGSTYKNCFVHYKDIANNPKIVERNRILYTSITRPKDLLIIAV